MCAGAIYVSVTFLCVPLSRVERTVDLALASCWRPRAHSAHIRNHNTAVPMLRSLASLEAEWQPYSQGAEVYAHGLALPTANSLRGSVVADENVLAVRSLTLPPLTQGPYLSLIHI